LFRFLFALVAILPLSFSQTLPAISWIQEIDASGLDTVAGLGTDAHGNIYIAGSTLSPNFRVKSAVQSHLASSVGHNVYVTKLDPSGNVVYSTFFGGNGDDLALVMTVDAAGGVYVAGTTSSTNFPVTQGAYSSVSQFASNTFLFKLNPDGSAGYSTYFVPVQPTAIAVDGASSAYLAGTAGPGLPTTAGAYQTVCGCGSGVISSGIGPEIFTVDGFVTKFDSRGSTLLYSTYLGYDIEIEVNPTFGMALAPDGSAYVAGPTAIVYLNSSGSSLLGSLPSMVSPTDSPAGTQNTPAIAVGPDGNLYLAGAPENFQTTPGAFQANSPSLPPLADQGGCCAAAIVKIDPQLQTVLAATYFGGAYGQQVEGLTLDPSGNVFVAGYTAPRGLPTRTPLQEPFGFLGTELGPVVEFTTQGVTGFLSELSNDLSTLLFSTYLGDNEAFGVLGLASGANGAMVIGGLTGLADTSNSGPANVWVNSVDVAPPPSLRIDSIVNAASLLDGAISTGETIVVRGAGFGGDAQLRIGGTVIPAISISPTQITAVVPSNLPNAAAVVQVQSGGAASNKVLVPVAVTSPGIFSVDGSGVGQGYILNPDGTLNSPSNPVAPGDRFTVYVTGVGPVSFTGGYAVTATPVAVYVDGFYCDGVAAVMGPVKGFPGSVYQLTLIAPNPPVNPNLAGFGVILQIAGGTTQNGLTISIAQ
jgi:uncharacterized protein (TIGR03437 family)